MAANPRPATFNDNAQIRVQEVTSIPLDTTTPGTGVVKRVDLFNSGYLQRLYINHQLTGTYATAGPTAADFWGAFGGALARVIVEVNSVVKFLDVSGEGLAVISMIDNQYRYGFGVLTGTNVVNFTAAPGTSAFTDNFNYSIPIGIDFSNFPWPIGLYQTALNSVECRIGLIHRTVPGAVAGNPGSGVYSGNTANLAAPAGSTDIIQEYFDPILDPAAQPALAFFHQWVEWFQPLTTDGEIAIILPPPNWYTRVILWFITGATNSVTGDATHVTRIKLVYGPNLTPFNFPTWFLNYQSQVRYGVVLPNGCYVLDLLEDTHMDRDMLNSGATTNMRILATLSGATYGSGAGVKIIAEQLIPVRSGQGVGVQGGGMAA